MVKTCCFFGHGKIYGEAPGLSEALADAVEQHITEYGVTDFLVGNYGAFDYMAAHAVKGAKARHPGVYTGCNSLFSKRYVRFSYGYHGNSMVVFAVRYP